MQPARHLVGAVFELAAGVQHRQDDFRRRLSAFVLVDRNATAVVDDSHRFVDVNRDVDLIAESRQRFVDGVVDDLVDEMMQPGRPGRSDVHRRTFLDGLETLENLNLVRRVIVDVFAQSGGPCPPDALRGDPFAPLRFGRRSATVLCRTRAGFRGEDRLRTSTRRGIRVHVT